MTLANFVRKKPYLFWHVKNPARISEEAAVEGILNYGDFGDVKKLFSILGLRKTAFIFRRHSRKRRSNYDPKIANYFRLYFRKHSRRA